MYEIAFQKHGLVYLLFTFHESGFVHDDELYMACILGKSHWDKLK